MGGVGRLIAVTFSESLISQIGLLFCIFFIDCNALPKAVGLANIFQLMLG